MIALRTVDVRNDFKRISELINAGEKILIARPHNQNLVVLSENDYNELEKSRRNAEYLAKINTSVQQIKDGKTITKTFEELEEMAQ